MRCRVAGLPAVRLEQLLLEAPRVGSGGIGARASLAMLDAIDCAAELGTMRGGEAVWLREVVREAFWDVDQI